MNEAMQWLAIAGLALAVLAAFLTDWDDTKNIFRPRYVHPQNDPDLQKRKPHGNQRRRAR